LGLKGVDFEERRVDFEEKGFGNGRGLYNSNNRPLS